MTLAPPMWTRPSFPPDPGKAKQIRKPIMPAVNDYERPPFARKAPFNTTSSQLEATPLVAFADRMEKVFQT